MEHKLSKAQIEAKAYVETHKLEKIIGDMLNALVYSKDPHPTVFMIKYLASLAGPSELQENGIIIGSQTLPSDAQVFKIPAPKPKDPEEVEEIKSHSAEAKNHPKPLPVFPHNSKSLVQKHMSESVWNKLHNTKTKLNHDLHECLTIGLQHADSVPGIYAADSECYEVFQEIFEPVIEEIQQWTSSNKHTTVLDLSHFKCVNCDPAGEIVKSIKVSIDRNIIGFSFPIGLNPNERAEVQQKIQEILDPFLDSSFTRMDDSRAGENEPSLIDLFKDKFSHTDLARDWPNGRGIFVADDLTIAVNLENHIQFLSKTTNGDLEKVFNKVLYIAGQLNARFEHNNLLGFLTSSPENIGTGIQASVILRLENVLKKSNNFKFDLLACNIFDGEYVELTICKTLGVNEEEIFKALANAIEYLVFEEKRLTPKIEEVPEIEESEIRDVEIVKDENLESNFEEVQVKTVEEVEEEREKKAIDEEQ
ncbi:hypothetical protein SteCoe_20550 [Stentor coeruleus]|uniref:Uncharacterized protein n=1 Tax=Stentor coeruleus TaxID=5963 RepID=A0A1R2BRL6_9CILI|nr:hypothetical protein SteCoe_20550 [Stentor coeruleus]